MRVKDWKLLELDATSLLIFYRNFDLMDFLGSILHIIALNLDCTDFPTNGFEVPLIIRPISQIISLM